MCVRLRPIFLDPLDVWCREICNGYEETVSDKQKQSWERRKGVGAKRIAAAPIGMNRRGGNWKSIDEQEPRRWL